MKINWGTGIVIAMLLFMAFILQYVYKAVTNDKYNHELVSEDYYKDELYYQQEIDKVNNGNQLKDNIRIEAGKDGFVITFPKEMDVSKITGTAYFQRPSNKDLDFEQKLSPTISQLVIKHANLVSGKWNVKIDWKYNDKEYLLKEAIFY
ncbi:MAG TPA: cytochrome C oxidase Cbb3 [Flavobacteriia bacterium]|nr:cytochrome C oxidase Cbb3 [Flavobacteriia bacterium]